MSYGNYISIISSFLNTIESPKILEIGIEHGAPTLAILNNLIDKNSNFYYYGIDIHIRDNIKEFALKNKDYNIHFHEQNSLDQLPILVEEAQKFDLILLDGDHNYYTVTRELNYIQNLMHQQSYLIVDDYHGPWALSDYWYGEEHDSPQKGNPMASKKIKDDIVKHGVQTATNDWLDNNKELELYSLSEGELFKHNKNKKLKDEKLKYSLAVLLKYKEICPI